MSKNYYCNICKEEITEKEYEYSLKKFNLSLCRKHQKNNSKEGKKEKPNRKENMIKGRLAEALIEELFLSLGFNVFRYGMENTILAIMKLLKGVRSDVADNIRKMPDFVIQHLITRKVYFIEVKFRANENLKQSEFKNYPYENCFFILVSKKHIKCISYEELIDGKEISSKTKNYLGNRKEFINKSEDKDTIIEFCDFAKKFFANV